MKNKKLIEKAIRNIKLAILTDDTLANYMSADDIFAPYYSQYYYVNKNDYKVLLPIADYTYEIKQALMDEAGNCIFETPECDQPEKLIKDVIVIEDEKGESKTFIKVNLYALNYFGLYIDTMIALNWK